jgi:hypothetical protein
MEGGIMAHDRLHRIAHNNLDILNAQSTRVYPESTMLLDQKVALDDSTPKLLMYIQLAYIPWLLFWLVIFILSLLGVPKWLFIACSWVGHFIMGSGVKLSIWWFNGPYYALLFFQVIHMILGTLVFFTRLWRKLWIPFRFHMFYKDKPVVIPKEKKKSSGKWKFWKRTPEPMVPKPTYYDSSIPGIFDTYTPIKQSFWKRVMKRFKK